MDCEEMVSSSLAAVIRQSLNSDFRKECYLLLGATHNRDAQEVIYSRLKLRGSNVIEKKMKNPILPQNVDVAQKANTESHEPVLDQSTNNIYSKLPNLGQESHDTNSIPTPIALKTHNDPSIIQDSKVESIDPVESAQSDDEAQLDWDNEVC